MTAEAETSSSKHADSDDFTPSGYIPKSSNTVEHPLQIGCNLALWEGQRSTTWAPAKMVELIRDMQEYAAEGRVAEIGHLILASPKDPKAPHFLVDAQQRITTLLLAGFALLRLALEGEVAVRPASLAPLFHVDTLPYLQGKQVDISDHLEGRYGYLRKGRIQPRLNFALDGNEFPNELFHAMLVENLDELKPLLQLDNGHEKLVGGFLKLREHFRSTLHSEADFAHFARFLGEDIVLLQRVHPEQEAAEKFAAINNGEPMSYAAALRVICYIPGTFMAVARRFDYLRSLKITPFFNSGRDSDGADGLAHSLVKSYDLPDEHAYTAGRALVAHYERHPGTQVGDWQRFFALVDSMLEQDTVRKRASANFLYRVGVQANSAGALAWLARVDRLLADSTDEHYSLVLNELITFFYACLLQRNWRDATRELDRLFLRDSKFSRVLQAKGSSKARLSKLEKYLKGLDGKLHWPTKDELDWLGERTLQPGSVDVFDQTAGGMLSHVAAQSDLKCGRVRVCLNRGKHSFAPFKKGVQQLFVSSGVSVESNKRRDLGALNFIEAAGSAQRDSILERLERRSTTAHGVTTKLYHEVSEKLATNLHTLWNEQECLREAIVLNRDSEPLTREQQEAADAVAAKQRRKVGELLRDFYGADDSTGSAEHNEFREVYEKAVAQFEPEATEQLMLCWLELNANYLLTEAGVVRDGVRYSSRAKLFESDRRKPRLEEATVILVSDRRSDYALVDELLA